MQTPTVLDFSVQQTSQPRYRYLRVPLNNINNGEVTLSAASQLLEWKVPVCVYNLARSYIQYSLDIPYTKDFFNYTFEDLSISELAESIKFGTGSGLNLVDINYLQNYEKVALKAFTPYEEFISRDPMNSYYPATCIGAANDTKTNESNVIMAGFTAIAKDNYKSGFAAGANLLSPFKLTDPKYIMQEEKGVDGNPAAVPPVPPKGMLVRNRQIKLSDVKCSLMDQDRDFYSPIEMYLRLQTNVLSKVGVKSNVDGDPGPAAPGIKEALPADTKVKQIYLYLAVEQNKQLIDELINSVRGGGHRFTMPFTVGFRNAIAAGNQSVQIQLTSQFGKKLHHILFTAANTVEALNTAVDASNWNGEKIKSYQVYLDNRPMTDYIISCAQPTTIVAGVNADDWRENKHLILNKQINYGQYQLNWFHCDTFFDPVTGDQGLELTNSDSGLEMESVRLYGIQLDANPCTLYTYATFLREVLIDNQGNILFG